MTWQEVVLTWFYGILSYAIPAVFVGVVADTIGSARRGEVLDPGRLAKAFTVGALWPVTVPAGMLLVFWAVARKLGASYAALWRRGHEARRAKLARAQVRRHTSWRATR